MLRSPSCPFCQSRSISRFYSPEEALNYLKTTNHQVTMSTTSDTTSSPTSQSQIPASKQKIKFACDSCARYKVACPKQQPECERCVSKGRRCIYSVACRNGKPKKSKPKDPTKALPSPSESWTWPTSSPIAPSESEEPLAIIGPATNTAATGSDLPELATNGNALFPCNSTSGLPFTASSLYDAFWQPVDYPITSVDQSGPLSTYSAVSMYQCPNNYFPPAVHPLAWPRQTTSPLFPSTSSYMYESSVESTPSSGSSGSYSPTADAEAALLAGIQPLQLQPQTHDSCFARTYSLLNTLKRPSSNVCSFESADQSSPYLQPTVAESIDKILLNTDKATEHIKSVMQCSCHTTSSVRCALTLALFEVISWYETIVRGLNAQQRETRTQSSGAGIDEEYDSCSISQRARSDSNDSRISDIVSLPVVSIGDMQLRRADVKSVVGHLVLLRIQSLRGIVQNLGTDRDSSILGVERLENMTNEFMKMQQGEIAVPL